MDTKETAIYRAALIAAAIIGTIILYFVVFIFRQQRKHRRLYKAKIEAEITTLEQERARIAADLHDDLGPILSSAKFQLAGITSADENDAQLVKNAVQHINNIMVRLRYIANNLMPDTLLRYGPVPAIEEFITQLSASSNLKITVYQHHLPVIPKAQSIHVFRILQEIIHNTVKHANAKKLVIKLSGTKNKLLIATADDGSGFNVTKANREQAGRGLNNLRSRTDILSGELFVSTAPGKGTRYTIEIPLFK